MNLDKFRTPQKLDKFSIYIDKFRTLRFTDGLRTVSILPTGTKERRPSMLDTGMNTTLCSFSALLHNGGLTYIHPRYVEINAIYGVVPICKIC